MPEILDPEHLPVLNIRLVAAQADRWLDDVDRQAKASKTSVGRGQAEAALKDFENWHETQWLRIPEGRRQEAMGLDG